ncbi:reverse transcriptase domain, reverse transcriptase zinc-binding domain protein [Tanacetum coccineum]
MLHVPSTSDLLVWKDRNGLLHSFSVGVVWNSIRTREVEVEWAKVVWFTHCIHRHAFFLWLVIKQKLKTQDVLRQWDVSATSNLNMFRCLSSKSRSVKGVLPKLVLAALVYFIWQERNFRLFQKKKWSKEQTGDAFESCTLFPFPKVFPIGFYLEMFFKETISFGILLSHFVAASLVWSFCINAWSLLDVMPWCGLYASTVLDYG